MSDKIWDIQNNHIEWKVKNNQHHLDDIEMSGLFIDTIITYGVDCVGSLNINQECYFPSLRTIPNNTHATHCVKFDREKLPVILINGEKVLEYPVRFILNGTLKAECSTKFGFTVTREFFPSADKPISIEMVTINALNNIELEILTPKDYTYSYGRGTKGVYISKVHHTAKQTIKLKSGETYTYAVYLYCHVSNTKVSLPNFKTEYKKRLNRIHKLCEEALVLKSNIAELDVMTRFAKLRAGESIFETLSGKFHSPGGRAYYAAVWCNDQAEYAGPHFAMTGDKTAIEASVNAYKAYIPFMSDTLHPIPSSIIAEGLDIWEGASDRGDAAMYLYGASLFCLLLGDEEIAKALYPAIKWCADYCESQKTADGVISSYSDELEGRFPTDNKANLSTSSLCYGGLIAASKLALSLKDTKTSKLYIKRAKMLENAIENYFGAELHGFDTYRYSKGFDTLRSWICLPLCMGINRRKSGTLKALFSKYLLTSDGILTCERVSESDPFTIWDRSTLYTLKCGFICGESDKTLSILTDYCKKRLLFHRVPYAVEAYPEGDRRHLSAESALFVRVITEGIFGISPESFDSFSFNPDNAACFGEISLSKIHICNHVFDISIKNGKWFVKKDKKLYKKGFIGKGRVIIN